MAPAIVSMGSRHPSIAPKRSILPMRASTGICARCRPSGVRRSSTSNARRSFSSARAESTDATSGGVSAAARVLATGSSGAIALMDRLSFCSGVRSISGGCCGDMLANCARENMANRAPGAVRPERPRLCFAAACETHASASTDRPRCESQHISFARPVSTTYLTSSIVTDVSAMLVATTILRTPLGGRSKILRWSLPEREP
mmetsp:Transcript_12710/g.53762  ORF Transcript_12710/g.53762 Transcript_12710/m.53762 type:complete len:202 (+) Transcript_12710:3182-3787(+)